MRAIKVVGAVLLAGAINAQAEGAAIHSIDAAGRGTFYEVSGVTACRGMTATSNDNVSINRMDNYYQVAIDLNQNSNRYATGQAYIRAIIQEVPEYEALIDSYLSEIISGLFLSVTGLSARVASIKPNMNQDYIDEINGIASVFTTTNNIVGDGRLHQDEYWIAALLPDVVRLSACSALGIFGSASTNGNMIGRNLEWYPGTSNQMAKLHSVTIIKNGGKSVCLLGTLGFLCAVSGFNTCGGNQIMAHESRKIG